MACKEQTNKDLLIHNSITFDWKITNWSQILVYKKKCLEFNFYPDLKIYLNIWTDTINLNISVDRSSYNSSHSSLHCTVCIINGHGEERMKKSKDMMFQLYRNSIIFATWFIYQVKRVIHEDNLVLRFSLSVEKINVLEMFSQAEASTSTGMLNAEDTVDLGSPVSDASDMSIPEASTSNVKGENPVDLGNQYLETLSSDLSKLYDGNIITDCVLKVGDTKFPAHRAVLSARSQVFAAMFIHDTVESRNGEVDIQDVEAEVLSDVLHYIYSGKTRGLTENSAASMYTVSDRYALLELRDTCLKYLLNNLTIENICDAALLSHTHGEASLEDAVVRLFDEKLVEVLSSNKWKDFFAVKPLVANKLLSSAYLECKRNKKQ